MGKIPEDLKKMPGDFGRIPEDFGNMPGGLGRIPKDLGKMPEGPGMIPEDFGMKPEEFERDLPGKTDATVLSAGDEFDTLLNQYQRLKQDGTRLY